MARMMRAHVTTWQRWTASPRHGGWTYAYDDKGNFRVREERSWRREWAEDAYDVGSFTVNAGTSRSSQ